MNILVDIRLLGRGGLSGIEEYTRQITSNLLSIDRENTYRLFYNGVRKNPLPEDWVGRKNVEIIDWKMPNRLLDASSRFLDFPPIDWLTKTDVVLSPHFNIISVKKAPRIVTFHDLSFIHHPYFFLHRQKIWNWLQDYRRQALRAATVITDSQFTKSDLINSLGINESKIKVVYPGINTMFRPLGRNNQALKHFRSRYELFRPFILYLGTLEPRKNIRAAIKAFALLKKNPRFKELAFVIAGSPGWLYKDLMAEVKESRLENSVIFWGPVENHERVFLYNLAEVFIYPSFFEGFGLPPLEAQASGCPVVVSNRTSLPEIIGQSGLITDPWKTEAMKEALQNIIESRTVKDRLVKRGLENAGKFNWQDSAKRILACLTELKN